jgi:hypothetical protein
MRRSNGRQPTLILFRFCDQECKFLLGPKGKLVDRVMAIKEAKQLRVGICARKPKPAATDDTVQPAPVEESVRFDLDQGDWPDSDQGDYLDVDLE